MVLYSKLCALMPGGVSSPARAHKQVHTDPLIAKEGRADLLIDSEGKEYIDYCMSWGALIFGHAPEFIVEAVCEQVRHGSSFGLSNELEGSVAEKIIQHMPIEKVRFVSTGTEATMTAVRLARAFTGRNLLVKFIGHYHGHHDALLVCAGIPKEVQQYTLQLPFNDLLMLEKCFCDFKGKIAAVIVEPIAGNSGVVPGNFDFIGRLRELTSADGALLIFDEVITGFRIGLGGACAHFNVQPDLVTLAKIIGGGFPSAAVGGKKEIMDLLAPIGPVFQAGTFAGNPVAMCAGLQTLSHLDPESYLELKRKTDLFAGPIEAKKGRFSLVREGSMLTLFVENFPHLFAYLLERGIYFPPAQKEAFFLSLAHTDEHLLYTSKTICEYIDAFLS